MTTSAPTLTWLFFSMKGRIARQSYALAMLFLIIPQFYILFKISQSDEETGIFAFWGLMLLIVGFVTLWSTIALTIKRLHDLGITGWLSVLTLVPTISWIFVIGLMFIPSKPVDNEHGPPPFSKN